MDRVLLREDASGRTHRFEVPHARLGDGPVQLRAFAILANGRMAWSDYWARD